MLLFNSNSVRETVIIRFVKFYIPEITIYIPSFNQNDAITTFIVIKLRKLAMNHFLIL